MLAKWRADVTRVLTEENARAEIKAVHLKLVAAAYNFLHRCVTHAALDPCTSLGGAHALPTRRYGYINFGMVAKPKLM